jgi:hypothetical protein
VDPLVRQLEEALRPARSVLRPPEVIGRIGVSTVRGWPLLAAAALLVVVAAAIWYAIGPRGTPGRPTPTPPVALAAAWEFGKTGDQVKVAGPMVSKSADGETSWWVETGPGGSVEARGRGGERVTIGSMSAARVVEAADGSRSVRLEAGEAFTAGGGREASPVHLALGGKAVAGADFTVLVRGNGDAAVLVAMPRPGDGARGAAEPGRIVVKSGEAIVRGPGGAMVARVGEAMACRIDPDRGIGIPAPIDVDDGMAGLLRTLDAGNGIDQGARRMVLHKVIGSAGPRTLWNLLLRVQPDERAGVLKRLEEQIVAAGCAAPKVDPEAALRLEESALEAWWAAANEASAK